MLRRRMELYPVLAVIGGLVGLVLGADRFVHGASNVARALGVSPLMVGMLIVGIGTSAPEMLVSLVASLEGNGGIAIGNAIGSNVSNIGLVLGVTALVSPIPLQREVISKELPVLVLVTAGTFAVFYDGELDQVDGGVMVVAFALILFRMIRNGRRSQPEETTQEGTPGLRASIVWLVIGLVLLVGSSRGVVWGASTIAKSMGVSDLVIGLTIVAIGTSLPELAASIASALKGQHALAVGNVLGSNIFNLVAVLPFPGLLDPGPIDAEVRTRDYPVMLGITLALWVFARIAGKDGRLTRREGVLLLSTFLAYAGWLAYGAMQ